MLVDRRLPLLAVTRIVKDRRRIVLANRAFQRQLVRFARARGLLGELPPVDDRLTDGEDGRLWGEVRRLALYDRASNGVDWTLNGLRADHASHRLDLSTPHNIRSVEDWRTPLSRGGGLQTHHEGRDFTSSISGRYSFTSSTGVDLSPRRKLLPRSPATRSRETDDVTPSYVSPRQYRASKSATSLVPVSSSSEPRQTRVHSRSSSASRFSLGFL